MSIHVMNLVWRRATVDSGTLLVFLALADWSNDEGLCFPSLPMIAKKSRVTERQVYRSLAILEKAGFFMSVDRGGGTARNRYTLNIEKLESLTPVYDERVKKPVRVTPDKKSPLTIPPSTPDKKDTTPDNFDNAIRKNHHLEPPLKEEPSSSAVKNGEEQDQKLFTLTPKEVEVKSLQSRLTKHIHDWYKRENLIDCPWGPTEAGMLATVIKRFGSNPEEILFKCVDNRFKSDYKPTLEPVEWIPRLLGYRKGPLNEFGNLREGGASAPEMMKSATDELKRQGSYMGARGGRR